MKRFAIALILATGCSAPPFPVQDMVKEWAAYLERDHTLIPGVVLAITVWTEEGLAQEVTVAPEGMVNLLRIKEPVRAVGLSTAQFRQKVEELYNRRQPGSDVSVSLKTPSTQTVFVMGEVKDAGVYPWTSSMSLSKAIATAGGFEITAKTSDVLVVRAEPRNGAPRSLRVNLNDILSGESTDFPLLPGDVVYAQTSGVADAGNFVELYIRRLLPFAITGVSVDPQR